MTYLTLPRPLCWLVCSGVVGTIRRDLSDSDLTLCRPGTLVAIHSGHVGASEWHRQADRLCRDAGRQPPDRDALGHDEWRGVVRVVRALPHMLVVEAVHLYAPAPWWGTPDADAKPIGELSETMSDALMAELQKQQRRTA